MGDCFERVTNFELKATKHRVLDIGVERYSSPFFLEPRYDATIPSNVLNSKKTSKEPPIVYGEWVVKKLQTYVEWQGFVMPDMSMRRRNAQGEIVMDGKLPKSSKDSKNQNSKSKKKPVR